MARERASGPRSAPLDHAGDRRRRRVHRGARQHGAQRRDPDDPARLRHHAAQRSQWVITGYALTFATPAHHRRPARRHLRRTAASSSSAPRCSASARCSRRSRRSVPELIVGEAIIEGIGASLMLPATLAILSTTFQGRERATAFAAWGATAGVGVAFGPVVGGFLTTNYSWRWSFRINVIVAPLAIIGALLFMRRGRPRRAAHRASTSRARCLIAVGMFLLVFALSEGATYGWWRPLEDFSVAGRGRLAGDGADLDHPGRRSLLAVVLLVAFVRARAVRRSGTTRTRCSSSASCATAASATGCSPRCVLAMGQLGLPVRAPGVPAGRQAPLSAETNGFWLLPVRASASSSASQLGGRLTRYIGVDRRRALGLVLEVARAACSSRSSSTRRMTLRRPAARLRAVRHRHRLRQLAAHQRDPLRHPAREVGRRQRREHHRAPGRCRARRRGHRFGLRQPHRVAHDRRGEVGCPARVAARHRRWPACTRRARRSPCPDGTSGVDAAALSHALATGITEAVRPALLLAAGFVLVGAFLSLLLPRTPPVLGRARAVHRVTGGDRAGRTRSGHGAHACTCRCVGYVRWVIVDHPEPIAGRYRVDQPLGAGGMGTVYAGHDLRLDRDVAVKVLRDDLTRDPSLRHRFEREAARGAGDPPACRRGLRHR